MSVADDPLAVQSFPPNCGGGLSHNLVLIWMSPPQVTGHFVHSLQAPHPPFTPLPASSIQTKQNVCRCVSLNFI